MRDETTGRGRSEKLRESRQHARLAVDPHVTVAESPAYVQRQLGHASIQLTVDTYGRWLPLRNKAAVDALDTVADDMQTPTQTASAEPSRELVAKW